MLVKEDIQKAVTAAGVYPGDILVMHSSFKSLGPVDGGAETVISGLLDALGPEGTLVLPTFCQKEFATSYETWHMDKPSDTGYLTEYFRKRPGSYRSDQATHSVAASGAKAQWLTQTHGHTHKRLGSMGDTPFSADSPWEKMYHENAKILMLGVSVIYTTFRHYAEYVMIERCLAKLEGHVEYEAMKDRVSQMGHPGVWPGVSSEWVCSQLKEQGKLGTAQCGNATLLCYGAKDFVDLSLKGLEARDQRVLRIENPTWNAWMDDFEAILKG